MCGKQATVEQLFLAARFITASICHGQEPSTAAKPQLPCTLQDASSVTSVTQRHWQLLSTV